MQPVWNLKLLWKSFRLHGNLQRDLAVAALQTILHMWKWYLLINENLINAKQVLRYWLFFKQ